jgi:hypothetical protein
VATSYSSSAYEVGPMDEMFQPDDFIHGKSDINSTHRTPDNLKRQRKDREAFLLYTRS